MVVRDPRLNRAYDESVPLLERPDPDEVKKKRARDPEVEIAGPIAAPPLRSVRPRDDAGVSRSPDPFEERPTGKLPKGVSFCVARSGLSSASSFDRGYSRTEGAEVEDLGRTRSQVDRAIGTINLTGLAASESSCEASPSRVDEVDIEGVGDQPETLGAAGGKLPCFTPNFKG